MRADDAESFCAFAAATLGVPRGALTPETAYGSIPEWDSVMHLRLVMETEARYGVSFPLERIPALRRLADFLPYLPAAEDGEGTKGAKTT